MSMKAKLAFLGAFLCLISTFVIQFMAGGWLNLNSVLLATAAALVVFAVFLDWKLYWEFLTMRTTKHGMNMGVMILLVCTLLVCVNYLANKNNKTWDVTQEKLNSLSDQTTKVLAGLNKDLEIKVFYKGPQAQDEKQKIKQALTQYLDASGKIKVRYVNAYVDQQLALQYLSDQVDRDTAPVIALAEYGDKKIRIEGAFDEAAITAAIIKASREGATKVFFLQGHGEKDLKSDDDQGLQEFVKALAESSFEVEPLNLLDQKEVPADAAAIAIVGPRVPYLENEIEAIRKYAEGGGRIFLALDPGVKHGLAGLVKSLGVEFENNYVLSMLQIYGQGPATVLGRTFDPSSDITKSFPNGSQFAVFPLVSEVRPAPDKAAGFEVKEIVKSDERSFTMIDPSKPPTGQPKTAAVSIAVEVKGQYKMAAKKEEKKKDDENSLSKTFEAVVFGDSDFLSNRGIFMGVNRDLAVNALAGLTNQKDLISVRPKLPKGTIVTLTTYSRLGIIIALLALPVLLLISSSVLWFRRRGA
ncbi:MAG: GldG family protein [Bdellovibrionales bacterium]